jgi:Mg-chelatase subunit ChlD
MKHLTQLPRIILFISLLFICTNISGQSKHILLIDVSGSLASNDPHDLRKDALLYFINQVNQFENETSVAMYSFGETVYTHYKNNNIFINTQKNSTWLRNVIEELPRGDKLTDLRAGLSRILNDLDDISRNDTIHLLIFTDAQLEYGDIPQNITLESYIKDIYKLGDKFGKKNVIINGLAFTSRAKLEYLERLASMTGGNAIKVNRSEAANQAIMKLLQNIYRGPYPPNKNIPIDISESIISFTVEAFNKKYGVDLPRIRLSDPDGNTVNDVLVEKYKTSVSVTKKNPEVGKWTAYVKGAKDVEVYYHKKVNYDVQFHRPRTGDLNLVQGSQLLFDIEIKDVKQEQLENFSAVVSVTSKRGNVVDRLTLDRDEKRFKGVLSVDLDPGVYRLTANVDAPEEKITQKYVLHVEKGIDYKLKAEKDLVLGHPVELSVPKPENIENAEFEVIVNKPDNKQSEYDLFDDGLAKHNDAMAGDGIYSNEIDDFDETGVYSVEVILNYEEAEIPIKIKKIVKVYKTLSLKDEFKISFPRKDNWEKKDQITIENKSSHIVVLNDFKMDEEWQNKLDIEILNEEKVINPKGTYSLNIKYSGNDIPPKRHIIESEITADIKEAKTGKLLAENQPIALTHEFKVKPKPIFYIVLIGGILIGLIVLGIILGLFVVLPQRFKNVVYRTRNAGDMRLSGAMREMIHPWVEVEENQVRVGISLFGLGNWYKKVKDENDNWQTEETKFYNIEELSIDEYL